MLKLAPSLLAYYFPGYHHDPVLYPGLPAGWSEWQLVQRAKPFFAGHRQPRSPVWGCENELQPGVLAKKLRLAGQHGIDSLVFMTYEYGEASPGAAVLGAALDQVSSESARPAMMWANHRRYWCYPEPANAAGRVYLQMDYSREKLKRQVHRWCTSFWTHPNYYRLPNGLPLFSLYSPQALVADTGSADELKWFVDCIRTTAQSYGLPGIHLHACSAHYLDGTDLRWAGFDSCSDYLAVGYLENLPHKEPRSSLPSLHGELRVRLSMAERLENIADDFARMSAEMEVPYLPSVTVGRDCSPRVRELGSRRIGHYSSRPIVTDEIVDLAPAALEVAVNHLRTFSPPTPMAWINAWNEWSEGAYLEPEVGSGTAALAAVARTWQAAWEPAQAGSPATGQVRDER